MRGATRADEDPCRGSARRDGLRRRHDGRAGVRVELAQRRKRHRQLQRFGPQREQRADSGPDACRHLWQRPRDPRLRQRQLRGRCRGLPRQLQLNAVAGLRLRAPYTRWVYGALCHDYPGHRTTRRPVPAEDWNEMNPDINPAAGRPARLAVGIIGAGRAGTALGAALARAGHEIVAASAVSAASLRRAHANFPAAVITEPSQVLRRADLAMLTVPDDVLPGLIAGLAATGAPLEGRMLAHASGRYGVAVLEPAVRRGALPLALHPVMTFTGRADDIDRLRGTCFGVTAPEVLRPAAEALVIEMGGEPVFIPEEHRDLYHAALT